MRDLFLLSLRYLHKMWMHRTLALIVAGIVAVVGWAYVWSMPDIYAADARIYVDTDSMLSRSLEGVALDSSEVDQEFLRVARRTLLTRPNLEFIARETDLDLAATSPREQEELLERLRQRISVEAESTGRRGRENLFSVRYQSPDQDKALEVVETLYDLFIDSVLQLTQRDNSKMEQFLDEQIAEYETKLEEAEQRLKLFKQQNMGRLPDEGKNYFSMLQNVRSRLQDAQLELKQAEQIRDGLRTQLERARAADRGDVDDPDAAGFVVDSKQALVAALQQELAALRLRYTDQHPDVAAMRRRIDQALARDPSEFAGSTSGAGSPDRYSYDVGDNLVLQELRVELGKADSVVASARASLEEWSSRARELEAAVDTIPEVEAELTRLNRDYEIYKNQYEELVRRRESAKMSRQADLTADAGIFQVIEPPHVSATPVGPARPLLVSAVFLAALAAGAGVALLRAELRPSFGDVRELRDLSGLPVLGRVGEVRSTTGQAVRSLGYLAYVGFFFLLVTAYLWMLLIHALGLAFPAW